MPTDVSSFKDAYKTAIKAEFPDHLILQFDEGRVYTPVRLALRYGTNPHQPFTAYANPHNLIANIEMLKGGKAGLSLTNLQDMSQAMNILRYFPHASAAVIMKHVNPCGFKVQQENESLDEIYRQAKEGDERSAFGGVVGFNSVVDEAATKIMESFIEGVIAPGFSEGALEILRKNEDTKKLNNSIRVAQYNARTLERLPKFVGDDVTGFWNIRTLIDGTITVETPYLTRIKSTEDFIVEPMIPNSDAAKNGGKDYVALVKPTTQQLLDCETAWYLNMNVRSNGVVFVKDGQALAVGTGEQERIGAVEKAIDKAVKKKHNLEGSVMSSDGFFPSRDCIDEVAKYGVKAVVWPAGSMNDALVIEAANEHGITLLATLERCFLHI